ncbi:MAG: domain S-box protein, partial [Bacteroidota bacterium]|nr:domain S-box protein [Bacteroidota bacterium]
MIKSLPVHSNKKNAKPAPALLSPAQARAADREKANETVFPIVAIGASSGGLEAVTELLRYLPANTGMAFIFIQHLSPDYKSILASLLAKSTKMKVQVIEDMELMHPNNVYVIPYNKGIEITDGHIQLIPRSKSSSAVSIDVLFTSLAEKHKENAIGIVLSGNASDGTMGLKAIRREGGITFAQDNSAKYGSMPESAISEGVADFILSPKEIALELTRIAKHTFERNGIFKVGNENKIDDQDPELKTILQLLHNQAGVDFSQYKMGTIKRRILRRMFLYKLENLKQYEKLLRTKSDEADVLYNDLLINVTDFFRDEDTFQYLKTTVFPKLLKSKQPGEPLRIWVAACSTGQEAYSIAMLLLEILGKKFNAGNIQI